MLRRSLIASALLLSFARVSAAQAPARTPEPPLRRWFEFQQFVFSTRYRFIRSSADVVTSNQMQYREQIRGRLNLDARKHYTLNAGFFSGNNFIGSWNATGVGTGDFDGHDHYMRQLFLSATPVPGIEGQFGGLYSTHGESTEYTSYDDDGYLVGGRVNVRRPKALFFDEVDVTRGTLASTTVPNVWKRWDDLGHPNYTQVLVSKRFAPPIAASMDYTRVSGTSTLRAGVALRFKSTAPISALRYEQYVRLSGSRAAGFAVTAERPLPRSARLLGGYATVDERYGGLNSDRIQRGRRFYVLANVPLVGPLSASFFATRALDQSYSVSNKTRFDAIIAWDVLNSLRKTGVF